MSLKKGTCTYWLYPIVCWYTIWLMMFRIFSGMYGTYWCISCMSIWQLHLLSSCVLKCLSVNLCVLIYDMYVIYHHTWCYCVIVCDMWIDFFKYRWKCMLFAGVFMFRVCSFSSYTSLRILMLCLEKLVGWIILCTIFIQCRTDSWCVLVYDKYMM